MKKKFGESYKGEIRLCRGHTRVASKGNTSMVAVVGRTREASVLPYKLAGLFAFLLTAPSSPCTVCGFACKVCAQEIRGSAASGKLITDISAHQPSG